MIKYTKSIGKTETNKFLFFLGYIVSICLSIHCVLFRPIFVDLTPRQFYSERFESSHHDESIHIEELLNSSNENTVDEINEIMKILTHVRLNVTILLKLQK